MYGPKQTKSDIQQAVGLKGKELTAFIRQQVSEGRMVRRMIFKDPVRGGGQKKLCIKLSLKMGRLN